MADFTQVKASLWQDPEFEILEPSAKLLWLNFLTTPTRNTAGLFHMSIGRMAFETGMTTEQIHSGLAALTALGWIQHHETTGVLWITNFVKRQPFGPTIKEKILKDVAAIGQNHPLSRAFLDYYASLLGTQPIPKADPTDTQGIGSARGDGTGRDGDGTGTGREEEAAAPVDKSEEPAVIVAFALRELPPSQSTAEDYTRTLQRHEARLPRETIERIICELAEWRPNKPRDKLHLTLNKWLAREAPPPALDGHAPPSTLVRPDMVASLRAMVADGARPEDLRGMCASEAEYAALVAHCPTAKKAVTG